MVEPTSQLQRKNLPYACACTEGQTICWLYFLMCNMADSTAGSLSFDDR